jgi:hypothetical protein
VACEATKIGVAKPNRTSRILDAKVFKGYPNMDSYSSA